MSPSAFKKHSNLFEDFEESGYKVTQSVFKSEIPAKMCVPAETAEMCYDVIMLMHKNPNLSLVLLSITLSPSSICRMINRGYILAQTKWLMKRK